MVLEQIFRPSWIEKKPLSALILGILYSIIGIISAKLIFGANAGLMSVAFTAILMIPSINILFRDEENIEIREQKLSLKLLFKDHWDIFTIYFFLFMGVFFTYAFFSLLAPFAFTIKVFAPQLKVGGITGGAFMAGTFYSILLNNFIVLGVCFVLSLVYGAGSILFITWNASVWGIIFGYVVKQSSGSNNLFLAFGIAILPLLPHLITEAVSYFSASIVGGVVSKAVIREKLFSEKFHHIITDALIFLTFAVVLIIIAAAVEVAIMS